LEAREEELSVYAVRSARCRGRKVFEPPSPVRTEFQRDRDRIIHTNSFRRLKHKSQTFVAPVGDHYVTRLTHVIEVAQIGRTIARALDLNEDLVEAAALGHDLGHTPFGHIGEAALDRLLPGGFHHSRHGVRIVEILEKDGEGLNLTEEVVDAIRRHSKPPGDFLEADAVSGLTLEAQIVRLSDALAYLTHDIGDAIRSGSLDLSDLPEGVVESLGRTHAERVNTLVNDVVQASWDCTGEAPLRQARPWIRMSAPLRNLTTRLRNFMFERFYIPISQSREGRRAADIVELLFAHHVRHPETVPEWMRRLSPSAEQAAADWVCGMTDNYALTRAEELRPGISEGVFQGRV
jgi:dGTPase